MLTNTGAGISCFVKGSIGHMSGVLSRWLDRKYVLAHRNTTGELTGITRNVSTTILNWDLSRLTLSTSVDDVIDGSTNG